MSTHSLLALRNILRSVSPPQEHFASTDSAPMSSSSSSSAAAADHDPALATSSSSHNLKRLASPTFEGLDGDSRKRAKTNGSSVDADTDVPQTNPALANATQAVALSTQPTPSSALLDDLEQELLCGCCSALLYRPVIVFPCEHYFCGSCCSLWVRNGGTNCPACRGLSTSVTPSRVLQVMVDVLLRADSSRGRTDREKQQADEIYRPGQSFRIPTPREASPEPTIPQTGGEYARPCPHCLVGNRYGWRCPRPVPDPISDPDNAWHVDDGSPPGHGYCGNCENLLALTAPTTTKCDMCQVSFCGIGIQNRCVALPLMAQHPHGLSDVGDLIQSSEVYDAFDGNAVEVEIMLDYFTAKRISPRDVYREIVEHIQTQPNKFQPLIDLDLFLDVHAVAPGPDPGPNPPRERICRLCATEIVLWGLKDWWIRERRKGELDRSVTERRDCVDGAGCRRQREHAHAKEFNHIMNSLPLDTDTETAPPPAPLRGPGPLPPMDDADSETEFIAAMPRPPAVEALLAHVASHRHDPYPQHPHHAHLSSNAAAPATSTQLPNAPASTSQDSRHPHPLPTASTSTHDTGMQMEFYVEFTPEPSPTPSPSRTPLELPEPLHGHDHLPEPLHGHGHLPEHLHGRGRVASAGGSSEPGSGSSSATRTGLGGDGDVEEWDGEQSQSRTQASSSSSRAVYSQLATPTATQFVSNSQAPTEIVYHGSQVPSEIGYTDTNTNTTTNSQAPTEVVYPSSQAPTEIVYPSSQAPTESSQESRDPYHAGVSAELGRLLNGYVGPAYGHGHGHGGTGMGHRRGESASEAAVAVAVALALRDGDDDGDDEGDDGEGERGEHGMGMDTEEDFVFGRRAREEASASADAAADLAEIMERRRVAEGYGYAS